MPCNIDARGKAVRLRIGLFIATIGIALVVLNQLETLAQAWALCAGLAMLAVGIFAIIEGWAGWCAVRAMGFKTRV